MGFVVVLAQAIGAWTIDFVVLRTVFLLKTLLFGQLSCSSHGCLASWFCYHKDVFFIPAILFILLAKIEYNFAFAL